MQSQILSQCKSAQPHWFVWRYTNLHWLRNWHVMSVTTDGRYAFISLNSAHNVPEELPLPYTVWEVIEWESVNVIMGKMYAFPMQCFEKCPSERLRYLEKILKLNSAKSHDVGIVLSSCSYPRGELALWAWDEYPKSSKVTFSRNVIWCVCAFAAQAVFALNLCRCLIA